MDAIGLQQPGGDKALVGEITRLMSELTAQDFFKFTPILAEEFASCVDHLLEHEADDFKEVFRSPEYENWLEPYNILPDEWHELRNAYNEIKQEGYSDGNEYILDRIFDHLAECSTGHVYCSACRASNILEKLKI